MKRRIAALCVLVLASACGDDSGGASTTSTTMAETSTTVADTTSTTTDSRALAFGLKSRYAETFELLPEPSAPAYGDRLLAAVRRLRPEEKVLLDSGPPAAAGERPAGGA